MTAAISTLRSTLAAALVDNSLYSVFAFPPATPIVNSVVISPAADYIVPSNNVARIQETHIFLGHLIFELVEDGLLVK